MPNKFGVEIKRRLRRWRKKFVIAGLLALALGTLSIPAFAATCQSNVASGNWGTGSSWAGAGCVGTVPRSTDTVTILNGDAITLNVSSTVVSVTINAGGSLIADANNRVLTITPGSGGTAFSVTASTAFKPNNSTIVIGTTATPIAINVGTITFNNLMINSTVTAASTYNFGSSSVTCLGTFTFNPLKASAGSISVQLNMGAPITVASTTTIMATTNAIATFTTTANNYAFTTGHLNIANNGAFLGNGSQITLNAANALLTRTGTFVTGSSTVTFAGSTSNTLSGSTTFYSLSALTANTTLYFTAGATQYVTNMLELRKVVLRSTTDNATWYFRYSGSSQTVVGVEVKDSNAYQGSTLICDPTSVDLGNNSNWAFGDVRYWSASAASGWSNTASWSRASGGTTGAPIPTSTHTVVFNGANGKNGQINLDAVISVSSLTISGYSGTFNTQGYNITVSSSLTQTSGTITLTTNTVSVGGDFIHSPSAAFNAGSSTITLTGSQNQNINFGTATIFNLNVNKTGGTATLVSALTSTGSLTIAAGTFDTGNNWSIAVTSHVVISGGTFNLNNSTMSVMRDWTFSSGVINAGGSTVTFTGGNVTQNITSNGENFFNIAVNKGVGSVVLQDAFDADGSFTNTLGTFNTNTKALSIGGSWNAGAGTFTGIGSTVTFNSATQSTLTGRHDILCAASGHAEHHALLHRRHDAVRHQHSRSGKYLSSLHHQQRHLVFPIRRQQTNSPGHHRARFQRQSRIHSLSQWNKSRRRKQQQLGFLWKKILGRHRERKLEQHGKLVIRQRRRGRILDSNSRANRRVRRRQRIQRRLLGGRQHHGLHSDHLRL